MDTGEVLPYGIIYNGDGYPLSSFFTDLGVSMRLGIGLSDRAADGSIYVSGTCDTADGIRGWLMCLTPDVDGILGRTVFSIAQPMPGDDVTSLRNVNNRGEAVGYSRFSGNGGFGTDHTAIYYTTDAGTIPFAYPVGIEQFITNSGDCVGYVWNADDSRSAYVWTPGSALQFLVDVQEIRDVNNFAHFTGIVSVAETTKRNTTVYRNWNCFFDGTLTLISDGLVALNDNDDLLFLTRVDGKGNEPPYYSGAIYFTDLDRQVAIDDMIDPQNAAPDLDLWFGSNTKWLVDVTNSEVVVGYIPPESTGLAFDTTFVLIPIVP